MTESLRFWRCDVVVVSLRGIRDGGSSQSRGDGERTSIETSADLKTIQVSLKTSVEDRHGPAFKMVGNPAMWGLGGYAPSRQIGSPTSPWSALR